MKHSGKINWTLTTGVWPFQSGTQKPQPDKFRQCKVNLPSPHRIRGPTVEHLESGVPVRACMFIKGSVRYVQCLIQWLGATQFVHDFNKDCSKRKLFGLLVFSSSRP